MNVINPGPANTPMLGGFGFDADVAEALPLKRLIEPEDIADAAAYLATATPRDHRRRVQHRRRTRPVTAASFMAVDPSTGHEFAELPATSPAQVAEMVEDARRALAVEHDWRTPLVRAGALLRDGARLVEEQAEKLAEFETRDTGKPLSQSQADVRATVRYLEYYAGSIERLEGRTIPLGPDALDYTVREPWGVCAQIIPWNYPLQVAARCAAPALAAGNAVILKPSELASITPLRLAADRRARPACRAGCSRSRPATASTGDALVEHPGVDHVTFVGSAATGAKVAEACARRLVPIELELGGKSPNVVFADADLEQGDPRDRQRRCCRTRARAARRARGLLVEKTRLRGGHRRAWPTRSRP